MGILSMTALTLAALRSHRVNLRLNLFGWHGFAREGVQLLQHPAQVPTGALPEKLLIQQFPQASRFQQPVGLGLFHQRLWQVQLNRNAYAVHNMAASALACQPGKLPLLTVSLSITPLNATAGYPQGKLSTPAPAAGSTA